MAERAEPEQKTPETQEGEAQNNLEEMISSGEWQTFRRQVEELANLLEKMRLADYIAYLNRPKRMLWMNFIVSLVRGLGVALGASILAALALYLLKQLVILNLPLIGGLIAELVRIVNLN